MDLDASQELLAAADKKKIAVFISVKPIFNLATLFARSKAKTRIRQRDWLKLASEKIRRKKVGSVPPSFVCSRE